MTSALSRGGKNESEMVPSWIFNNHDGTLSDHRL